MLVDDLILASWVLSDHGANSVSVRLTVGIIIFYSVFTLSICLRSCQLCAVVGYQQAAVSGQFVDVRTAMCSDEADASRIRSYIAGNEDQINSMLGHRILALARPESA